MVFSAASQSVESADTDAEPVVVCAVMRGVSMPCAQGVDSGHIHARAVREQLEAATHAAKIPAWMQQLRKRVSDHKLDPAPPAGTDALGTARSRSAVDAPLGRSPSTKRAGPATIAEVDEGAHASRSPSWRRKLPAPLAVPASHVVPASPRAVHRAPSARRDVHRQDSLHQHEPPLSPSTRRDAAPWAADETGAAVKPSQIRRGMSHDKSAAPGKGH